MQVRFNCPKCGRHFEFPASAVGLQRRCVACGASFTVIAEAGAKLAKPATAQAAAQAPAAGAAEEAGEKARSPMPFVIGGVAVAVVGVALWLFAGGGAEKPPEKEPPKKVDEGETVGVSPEMKLVKEAELALAESAKWADVKDMLTYGSAMNAYQKMLQLQKGLEVLGDIREREPRAAAALQKLIAARATTEGALIKYVGTHIPQASSLGELLGTFARPELPDLRDAIYRAVLAAKPELAYKDSISSLRVAVGRGKAHEVSEPEREAWGFLLKRGDPAVVELLNANADEALKLCAPPSPPDTDKLLAATVEKGATKATLAQLYSSAAFRFGGKPKVKTREGDVALDLPELLAAIGRVAARLAVKWETHEHVAIIKSVLDRGGRETWGDRFTDLYAIGGDDPKVRAQVAVVLIQLLPSLPPDREPPLLPLVKASLPHFTDADFSSMMLSLRERTGELTADKVLAMVEETPVPGALSAALTLAGDRTCAKRPQYAKLAVQCYGGADKDAMTTALFAWGSEPLDQWTEAFEAAVARGLQEEVAAALARMLESGPKEEFVRVLRVCRTALEKSAKYADALVPAVMQSYQRQDLERVGDLRKAIITKFKTEKTLPEMIGIYARVGYETLGLEFQAILKGLLDKRAVRFLIWITFEKSGREQWGIDELRRITGQSGALEAEKWQSWFKANEKKLPAQIETPEMKK